MIYKPYYEISKEYEELKRIASNKEREIRLNNNVASEINKLVDAIPERQKAIKLFSEYKEKWQKEYAKDMIHIFEIKQKNLEGCEHASFYKIKDDICNRTDRFLIEKEDGYFYLSEYVKGVFNVTRFKDFNAMKRALLRHYGNAPVYPILRAEFKGN